MSAEADRFGRGSGIFRRKPVDDIAAGGEAGGADLTRTLGLWLLTAIGVGGIIGAASPRPAPSRTRTCRPGDGFCTAFASVGLSGPADVIAVGAIIGILTVMFTFMLGVTRVWHAMSRDGLLPAWFAKLHPVRRVIWIAGIVSAGIAGFLPIRQAAELTNIGILPAFVVVCVAVIVLRYRRPELPRTFRLPGMPVVPALGVVFSLWLITFLAPVTWLRFAVWLALGIVSCFGYGRRPSLLNRDGPVPRRAAQLGGRIGPGGRAWSPWGGTGCGRRCRAGCRRRTR